MWRRGGMEGRGHVEGRDKAWQGQPHGTLSWMGSPSELDAAQRSFRCKRVSRSAVGLMSPHQLPHPCGHTQDALTCPGMPCPHLSWAGGWLPQETFERHS